MNDAQKKVLRNHHGDILKNLVLDQDILGFLLHKDILSESLVQAIQAKPSQHEKITELLLLLPKRGVKAFPIFLEAVKKYSPYLGDKIEMNYEKEQKLMAAEHKEESQNSPKHDVENEHSTSAKPPKQHEKAFEKTFKNKEITERRHSLSVSTTNHTLSSNIMQQHLNNMYTKLKSHLHKHSHTDRDLITPEPITFKMVDKLLDDVCTHLDEHEMTFSQCHALLGGRDRNYPLVSHIINIQKAKRQLEQDVKEKEIQKNKYADHISKLENRCRNQTTEINHLNEEIKKLKEDIEKLQAINSEREEKQKIIDELRKMVMDADTTKKSKLRSSYLALHYDTNSTEIKQLRAEARSLKLDNENLKTENLMLKKSDNLKKLAKMREDQMTPKLETVNGPQSMFEEAKGGNPKMKQRQAYGGVTSQSLQARSAFGRRLDVDRGMFASQPHGDRALTRGSVDNLHNTETEDRAKVSRSRERERDYQDLDFKFSNSQNGAVGQKRSPSKDRSNKRVTFLSDTANQYENNDNVVRIPTGNEHPEDTPPGKTEASENGPSEIANGTSKGGAKQEKSRGRSKGLLKSKAQSKRSASLNSMTASRDIMKMSSHLIQKSRNLRQPSGN
ncbi:myosin heavy chain, striated muscle-like [Mercenaria mercenaria]|uniref:myosin heavy chain, striated muscle-like n=1 Tax=Mercenaria mercenaria TaxID=6596 RepID=UPI00234EFF8F|nr:myosin heavy chain, striated muscle-like [Mercenaria mercenaria]